MSKDIVEDIKKNEKLNDELIKIHQKEKEKELQKKEKMKQQVEEFLKELKQTEGKYAKDRVFLEDPLLNQEGTYCLYVDKKNEKYKLGVISLNFYGKQCEIILLDEPKKRKRVDKLLVVPLYQKYPDFDTLINNPSKLKKESLNFK